MKKIAVSQRVDIYPERNEVRDSVDQRLLIFLSQINACVIPIPNKLGRYDNYVTEEKSLRNWLCQINVDGFVLSGGNDPFENKSRDKTENLLMDFAEKNKLPLLGICRGMQMLGIREGANLQRIKNHVKVEHKIKGEISGTVNSFHNLAFTSIPNNYITLAETNDGCIEAIKHKALPWEGWMWHPERYKSFNKSDINRLKHIFGEF